MARGVDAVAGRLDAVELHVGVVEERVEHADRVGAAADAGDDGIRKASGLFEELLARLFADDLLEVAHHRGERMRSRGRAEDVVGVLDARDPVAVGVVDRVLERARAGLHRDHLGAEQPHAGDVERLALGVDLAHVDRALEPEERRGRGGGDAVLAGARLGDHAGLAEALGEQRLAEHVVDLVRAGVVEVLALEEHAGAAGVLGEPGDLGDGRRPAGVRVQQAHELGLERGIRLRGLVLGRQLVDRGDERFGHVAPAELAEEGTGCLAKTHDARLQERARGCDRVVGHQRLADEHDIGAGRAVVGDVGGDEDRGLGDLHGVGGDALGEAAEQVAIEVEGRQVAGVHADEPCAEVRGAIDLVRGVRLDQRRHPQLEREGVQARRARPARARRR